MPGCALTGRGAATWAPARATASPVVPQPAGTVAELQQGGRSLHSIYLCSMPFFLRLNYYDSGANVCGQGGFGLFQRSPERLPGLSLPPAFHLRRLPLHHSLSPWCGVYGTATALHLPSYAALLPSGFALPWVSAFSSGSAPRFFMDTLLAPCHRNTP